MLRLSVPGVCVCVSECASVCVCLPSLKEKLELLLQNRSGPI